MAKIYPLLTDEALRACFFRKKKGKKWHRIIEHFPRSNVHLAYCGRLESYRPEKLLYAGEWNAGEYRKQWIECDICEWLFTDG